MRASCSQFIQQRACVGGLASERKSEPQQAKEDGRTARQGHELLDQRNRAVVMPEATVGKPEHQQAKREIRMELERPLAQLNGVLVSSGHVHGGSSDTMRQW